MKYSRGKWTACDSSRSPVGINAGPFAPNKLALVWLTDPDTKKRTPEFAGNAALMLGAAEMHRMLSRASRLVGSPLLKREIKALLEKIEKQAEELCPRKN